MNKLARRPRPAADQQGFTMMELLVTMLLLAIVLLGLAGLQMSTIRQVTASKLANEATRLAQLIIEGYKTIDYSAIVDSPNGEWQTEYNKDNKPMEGVKADGITLPGPFTAVSLIEPSLGGKLITVQIRWVAVTRQAGSGGQNDYKVRSITLSTQRFEQ